jgi:hypothetical protein
MVDDRNAIAARIQDWVVFRDSGDWERLRAIWGPDGIMNATFFRGSADDFIAAGRRAFGAAIPAVLHMLGGISVDVRGARAVSQAKATILGRGTVHDTPCEVACSGRFYDLWYKEGDVWLLSERALIYERDRLDPLNGAPYPALDPVILASFPPGYQHLAYMQQAAGLTVHPGLPGLTGAAVEALYKRGRSWLTP